MISSIIKDNLQFFDVYKKTRINHRFIYIFIESAVIFSLFFLYFYSFLKPLASLPMVDGFYHYRVSEEIWNSGKPWFSIPWLPFTVLGEQGVDHHWLWHLIFSPVTQLPFDNLTNLKISCAINAAMVPTGINILLRLLKVPMAPIFAALAIFSSYFLPGRFLMFKAQNIAILFICFYLYFSVQGRSWGVFLTAFLFMNSYHGAVILLPLSGIVFLLDGMMEKNWRIKTIMLVVIAFALALLVNPWYPDTVRYLLFHTIYKMLTPVEGISVGDEWRSTPLNIFFTYNWIANLFLVSSITALFINIYFKKILPSKMQVAFVVAALICGGLALFSNRFIEFYGVLALVSGTLGIVSLAHKTKLIFIVACAGCILLLQTFSNNMAVVESSLVGKPEQFEEVYQYLNNHGKEGDVIYTTGWGNLPQHVWQSSKFRYVNGLDPNYLAYQDKERFNIWLKLRNNHFSANADIALFVKDVFNVEWILAASSKMKNSLTRSQYAELILTDKNSLSLFRIK